MNPLRNAPAQIADSLLAALVALAGIGAARESFQFSVVVEILVSAGLMLWVQRKWGGRAEHTIILGLTGVLAGLWVVQFGTWPAVLALFGWFIYLSRRLRAWGSVPDNDVQTIRWLWDLGIVALVWTLTRLGHPVALVSLSVLLMGTLTVLVRIMAMHQAQLEETAERVSAPTRSLLLPLLGLMTVTLGTLGASAIFPALRSALLLLLLIGLGIYVLWVVWRDILLQVVVILGMGGLLYLGTRLLRRQTRPHPPHIGFRSPLGHHVGRIVPSTFPAINWGLILVGVGLSLTLFLLLRERRRSPNRPIVGPPLEIQRTKIMPDRPRGFYRSPSPLRHLVFRWLLQEARRGRPLHPGETLLQFSERHRPSSDQGALVSTIVHAYETERYGLTEVGRETVKHLERSLREQGLLKP